MKTIFRALTAATLLAAALPAVGQVLLLDVAQTIPVAGVLDNPCTPEPEALAFAGSTNLTQRVWLLPDGQLRLQFMETTAMEGKDTVAVPTLLTPAIKYAVSGSSWQDFSFEPLALSVLQYKKVVREGADDNFHSVLVLDFDPQNLQVALKLEGACDNGMP
jgi:hypothetical protein